jgi:hypothetical protein
MNKIKIHGDRWEWDTGKKASTHSTDPSPILQICNPLSPRGPSDAAKQKNRSRDRERGGGGGARNPIPPEGFKGASAMNEKASVSRELNAKHKKVVLPPCRFFSAELS